MKHSVKRTQVKKTFRYISMAALAMVGTMMSSCTSDDIATEAPQPNIKTVTMTIGFDEGAQTRALTAGGVKTFSVGEMVALLYKSTSGENIWIESEALTASDISDDGKQAKITVIMSNPDESKMARLIYPSSMANGNLPPEVNINDDESTIYFDKLADSQDGTLDLLSKAFDLCTCDDILGNMVLSEEKGAMMPLLTNRLAICKFTIKDDGGTDITDQVNELIISDGTNSYTINRTPAAGPIYVAMRPVANKDIQLTATTSASLAYQKSVSGQTLVAGSLYPINVKMEQK